ncbi:GspH/FimT family pseudopilin [Arenimonas sp. MALMAid1274]|uniref:GspH/FimT family pseudopilin n=1 Tax=Arenimonas sp. MALMAid1274 TaxID=3411630 RepID=UPI003B9EFBE6
MRLPRHGYSLPELAAVLAVMGVLLALGLPSFMQLKNQMQTQAASHELSASLVTARLNAVQRGFPVSICPADPLGRCREDGIWDTGWLVFLDEARARQPLDPGQILQHVMPAAGVRIRSVQARSLLRYLPDGRASGSNLTLRICSGDRRVEGRRIIVSNAGRPRMERMAPDHPECLGA